jgi:ABC-2 type transport system ATP-binding protein
MIEIKDIYKSFAKKTVLEGVSMKVHPNDICCVLGRNGAGKSTLINIIAQIIKQDSGEVRIKGQVFGRNKILVKEKIGMVGSFDSLIESLTGQQYLEFHGLLYNMPAPDIASRIKDLTSYFFEDATAILKPIRTYSSGMRMLLNITTAVFHKPDILLLDEPFANLDPVACEKLVLFLKEFSSMPDKGVLVSSHDLLYVDKLATRICVLDNRKIVFDGSKSEFTGNAANQIDKKFLELIQQETIDAEQLKQLF